MQAEKTTALIQSTFFLVCWSFVQSRSTRTKKKEFRRPPLSCLEPLWEW
jgi:hypothetical protein